MAESIITDVFVTTDKEQGHADEASLEFRISKVEDYIELYLNGVAVCHCGWTENLKHVFKRALEIWPDQ